MKDKKEEDTHLDVESQQYIRSKSHSSTVVASSFYLQMCFINGIELECWKFAFSLLRVIRRFNLQRLKVPIPQRILKRAEIVLNFTWKFGGVHK